MAALLGTIGKGCPPPGRAWTCPRKGRQGCQDIPRKAEHQCQPGKQELTVRCQRVKGEEWRGKVPEKSPSFRVISTHTGSNRKREEILRRAMAGTTTVRSTKLALCLAGDLPTPPPPATPQLSPPWVGPHQAAVGVGSGAGGQGMRGWETQSLHSGRGYGNRTQPQYTTNTVSGSDLKLWWEREVLTEGCLQDTSRIRDPPMQTSLMQGMVSSELWSAYPPGAAPARPQLPTRPLSVAAMRRCPPGQLLSTSSQVLPCSSLS